MPFVLLSGPRLEVTLAYPPVGVLIERHLAGIRVQPLATQDLCLGLDEPLLTGPLRVEGVRCGPDEPVRSGVARLVPPGRQLPNASEAALPALGVAAHHGFVR